MQRASACRSLMGIGSALFQCLNGIGMMGRTVPTVVIATTAAFRGTCTGCFHMVSIREWHILYDSRVPDIDHH